MQELCAKVGRFGWRWRAVALTALAVACGETSSDGGGDHQGPTTTANSTQGDTSGTLSSTNAASAISAGGGASVTTNTEGSVGTTMQVGGSGGSAGGGAEPECSADEDCRLFSDCCTCAAHPATGEAPEACPADCAQGRCEQYQIDEVRCSLGSCVLSTAHNCSPLPVQCESLPPECPDGTLPSVGENRCWTGDCIPSDLCGWRPDCSSCAEDEVCFRGFNDAFGTPYYCVPRPATCTGQADCGCAIQLCEGLGFQTCTDAADGLMQCSP